MLELVPNQSSMFLTPTYPARPGSRPDYRARSDRADADASLASLSDGPSSLVDWYALTTSSNSPQCSELTRESSAQPSPDPETPSPATINPRQNLSRWTHAHQI